MTKVTIFVSILFIGHSMMVSFSEGLLLADKVGLDPKVLVEVFTILKFCV